MLVMARELRQPLLDTLHSCGVEVLAVSDCNEAVQTLDTQQQFQVVLTDAALPDGDWRRVLEIVERRRRKIQVVVCSRLGDPKLWLDVLEEGGYDVLVEPYRREEIQRIVKSAAARSHMRSPARATSDKPKAARAGDTA